MRHALLWLLQTVAVLAAGVLGYGLTFLVDQDGPWPLRAVAGIATAAAVYLGAIRSRPRPWVAEPPEPDTNQTGLVGPE